MSIDLITVADILLTNGVLIWLGLRMVKRVDTIDLRVHDHEIRLVLTERGMYASTQKKLN